MAGERGAHVHQLRADGIVHALRADYDEAHRELSPGSALSFAIARALFSRGETQEYDMGPGLNDYKLRWATGSHETVDLRIHRRGLYPGLLHAVETAVLPAARRLREGLR
jgi:CelD/BcsL family acetyltransferase involved in cellulose biosynthesis